MRSKPTQVMMSDITDPEAIASEKAERAQFDSNWTWFKANAAEITLKYLGKCICISQEEVFAADTAREAIAMARAAHPDDAGGFICRIPREKTIRISAH